MTIGNLQDKAWYAQLALFVVVAGLVYGAFWYLVTSGTRAETQALNEQVATLMQQNEGARIASQRLSEFRAAYTGKQEEYEELKALLPEQRELTSILQGLQDRARGNRLVLRRFSPQDDVQDAYYSGKPIQVEVTSSFENLRRFFEEMARYQRIVSITDFKVNRSESKEQLKTIQSQFLLTAYYASAEKLQQTQ